MRSYLLLLLCLISLCVHGQEYDPSAGTLMKDSVDGESAKALTFSGFIEAYYGYDMNQPANNTRPGFVYAYNRHNEVTVNLAYIQGNYKTERLRAHIALATGTYMNANYASEPGVLRNIYEAYAGVKLSRKHSLWLDAGIMPSHIGFESANSQSCLTLTRSIIADNSPYFESGAKLGYTSGNGKWYIAALMLNGWQRIQRLDGNSAFCGGTQLMYIPTDKVTLNYSTFFGNDKPDSVAQTRIFHHLHTILHITSKLDVQFGLDYGMEQKSKGSSMWNSWTGSVLIAHYHFTPKIAVAVRGEYYQDKDGVIIMTGTPNGFNTTAYSANLDYSILKHVMWRIEGKLYNSTDAIFPERTNLPTRSDAVFCTSLSVAF